ncbi:hypothetical protein AX16_001157 [Volvariella volvacea WC 439]|nr:hypothetical protein AX16_001157 [Volvariella volvacea WC 439]
MAPPSLTNAPLDTILSIAELIDIKTLLQLRLVCHVLNAQISPVALRNIEFRLLGIDEDRSQQRLEACSQPLPAVYQHARRLKIKIDCWQAAYRAAGPQMAQFYKMIEQLKSLKSFKIIWMSICNNTEEMIGFYNKIPEQIVEAVFKATGGVLDKLVFKPGEHDIPLPKRLAEFRGLRELTIKFDKYGKETCSMLDTYGEGVRREGHLGTEAHGCVPSVYKEVLLELVRNNPGLQYLEVRGNCAVDFHDGGELFGCGGEGAPEGRILKLCKLTMTGVRFLHVLNTPTSPFTHLKHLDVPSRYSINPLDNLWMSLQISRTTLQTLRTHQISLPLISYLTSYSGLQHLAIEKIADSRPYTDPKVVAMFFHDVLTRHAVSLTKLRIGLSAGVDYLEGWSFNPTLWMPALRSLVVLDSLYLHPGDKDSVVLEEGLSTGDDRDTDISKDEDSDADEDDRGERRKLVRVYQGVIDHVESLPCLVTLGILWPERKWVIGKRRTGYMRWSWASAGMVSRVVKRLRSRNGVPKELVLYHRAYEACQWENAPDGDERWRYVDEW